MKTNNKIRLAALLLFGVLAYVANGQNIIRPKIECPNDIYVNAYNGVLFHQRPDLSIPTRGGNMGLRSITTASTTARIMDTATAGPLERR